MFHEHEPMRTFNGYSNDDDDDVTKLMLVVLFHSQIFQI